MKTFNEFLLELNSQIRQNLDDLKNDNSADAIAIKEYFLNGIYKTRSLDLYMALLNLTNRKIVPQFLLKYYDLFFIFSFVINAIETAKDINLEHHLPKLKFKPNYPIRTFYRFWVFSPFEDNEVLTSPQFYNLLYYKEPIKLYKSYSKYMSYTRSYQLNDMLTYGIRETKGQGKFLVTKHKFKPYFDLYFYIIHFLNALKRTFPTVDIKQLINKHFRFLKEKEVFGPTLSVIKYEDVVGYYEHGVFIKKEEEVVYVNQIKLGKNTIEYIKNFFFNNDKKSILKLPNNIILSQTPNTEISNRWKKENLLSKIIGLSIYSTANPDIDINSSYIKTKL
jgi:hypothetical protein